MKSPGSNPYIQLLRAGVVHFLVAGMPLLGMAPAHAENAALAEFQCQSLVVPELDSRRHLINARLEWRKNRVERRFDVLQLVPPFSFRVQTFLDPFEAMDHLMSLRSEEVFDFQALHVDHADAYLDISNHFEGVAERIGVKVAIRLKTFRDTVRKVHHRARLFPQESGRLYDLTELKDLIGVRLLLPNQKKMNDLVNDPYILANTLGIDLKNIKIDYKGGPVDEGRGRLYRAVHIDVKHSERINYEIQVMTEAMAMWHRWDHDRVYKNKPMGQYGVNLEKYSKYWVKTIREFEDCKGGRPQAHILKRLDAIAIREFGIRPADEFFRPQVGEPFATPTMKSRELSRFLSAYECGQGS